MCIWIHENLENIYIYIYSDFEFNFQPFYIGKGVGGRRTQHLRESYNYKDTNRHKCNTIRKIKEITKEDPIILTLYTNLSPTKANEKEIEVINNIGRDDLKTGPLTNKVAGGTGGDIQNRKGKTNVEFYGEEKANEIKEKISKSNTGKTRTDEEKQKMSDMRKGDNSYMYGVPKSDEIKQKISDTRIKEGTSAGINNPMYGKYHTEESKLKMSETSKSSMTEDKRQQMIQSNPRSKQVQSHDGKIFPSLSEAGKYYGFVGLTAPRARIKDSRWSYV